MTTEKTTNADEGRLNQPVGRRVPERDADCENQGFSGIADGCNNWPCYRTPLVKLELGWRCPTCGGCY